MNTTTGDGTTTNTYGYDDAGNRTDVDDINGSVSYGAAGDNNELTDDGVYEYEYDPEGNIVLRTNLSDDSYTEYSWDNRNRLTKVTDKDSSNQTLQVVEYQYDAFDRRSLRIVTPYSGGSPGTAVTTRFVYNGLSRHVMYDFIGSSPTAPSHRYLSALDQVFAQENVGQSGADAVDWLLADRLGSTRIILKNDGTLRQTIDYDPYGNQTVLDDEGDPGTPATIFLWAQLVYDASVDLHFSSTRVYTAPVGRWMSVDTIGFAGRDYNLGRYLGNNPTGGADPNGTFNPFLDAPLNPPLKLPDLADLPPDSADLPSAPALPNGGIKRIYLNESLLDIYDAAVERGDATRPWYVWPGLIIWNTLGPRSDPDVVIEHCDGTKDVILGG
ncbi:MAG: RHS repeat-associated core domain-containing protein [Pirellulales bacterium]